VLAWTLEDPEGVDAGLRLGSALWHLWRSRGHFQEGREWLERALARDGPLDKPRASALNAAAIMAKLMGDYECGQALYEKSLAIIRELGDQRGIAVLLGNLGTSALQQRELERARVLLEESLALRRELGDRNGVGYMLRCLGDLACALGDYPRAQSLLAESLTVLREPGGSTVEIASVLGSQSTVARLQGDLAYARSLRKENLVLLQGRSAPDGVAWSLEELALIEQAEQRSERAATLFGAAEKSREEISSPMPPLKRREYEQGVREARASLGEAAFATAWETGRHMTGEQAVAYALEARGPGPGADG
jgi:hypothetical protein